MPAEGEPESSDGNGEVAEAEAEAKSASGEVGFTLPETNIAHENPHLSC